MYAGSVRPGNEEEIRKVSTSDRTKAFFVSIAADMWTHSVSNQCSALLVRAPPARELEAVKQRLH